MRTLILSLAACLSLAAQPKSLFYMTDSPASLRSFQANAAKIDIIVPTVYSVDGEGLVWGAPDPRIVETAARFNVTLMPIIVNPGFKQDMIHALLASPAARLRMINSLLAQCRKYHYYGIQFDFENVNYLDQDLLTDLVIETSMTFAREGFKVSIAAVPTDSDYPGRGEYNRWNFINWRGAFDLKRLAEHVDFVSFMTYDQHTRNTPPGPVAGLPWVESLLNYALSRVPKEKISLGIPLYGRRWYAGMRDEKTPGVLVATISTTDALDLAAAMKVQPQWDAGDHAPWFFFYRDGIREYVFYPDARSFRDRYDLVKQKGLHGFSAWVLGSEDPQMWQELPARAGVR
jgi:spore germination protein YaaH